MIIPCPHCQVKLNLPENVEGKKVRCPSCKEVFRADKEMLEESVQAGLPEAAPTSVKPKPRDDDEERPRTKRPSRYQDDDEDDSRADDRDRDDFDRRDDRADADEIVANAKAQARPAGYLMLTAFLFTSLNIVGNAILSALTQMHMGPAPAGPGALDPKALIALTVLCLIVLFGPILIFVMLGAKSLLSLGSRGLIITAIVMNCLLFLFLGGGLAINVVVLAMGELPIPLYLILPTVVMNGISCVLNLGAAVMAIRVLMLADVSEAYAVRLEDLSRRRRY